MSLLEKHASQITTKASNTETHSVKVLNIVTYNSGDNVDGTKWKAIFVDTNIGRFFGFATSVTGIDVDAFIPDNGIDAKLTFKETSYEKKDGVKEDRLQIVSLKCDSHALRMMAIKSHGIALNLI